MGIKREVWLVNHKDKTFNYTCMEMKRGLKFEKNIPVRVLISTAMILQKRHGLKIITDDEARKYFKGGKCRVVFSRDYGIGDLIMLEPLIRKMGSMDDKSVSLYCGKPEIFKYAPYIDSVKKIKQISDESRINVDCENLVFKLSGYSEKAESRNKKHRTDVYNEIVKVDITDEEKEPMLYFRDGEKAPFKKKSGYRYVGIQFDAMHKARKYNRGADFIDYTFENDKNTVIVLLGSTRFVNVGKHERIIDLQGKTSLRDALCAVRELDYMIATDSGLMHCAMAMRIPTVAIFGVITPDLRIRYYKGEKQVIPQFDCIGCGDLSYTKCKKTGEKIGDTDPCMDISAKEIFDAYKKLKPAEKKRFGVVSLSKNAIYMINIPSNGNREAYDKSVDSVKRYAEKIGADFIVQRFQSFTHEKYTPHMEKKNISNLLEDYERVLYVDSDILIKPDAPDIFEEYKSKRYLYMLDETEMNGILHDKIIKQYFVDGWEEYNEKKRYYNTGVILASKSHAKHFAIGDDYFQHIYEQTYYNQKFQKRKAPIKSLNIEWNCMLKWHGKHKGYFVHYTNIQNRERELIKDYENYYGGVDA